MCVFACNVAVQCVASLRMDLDIANKRLEIIDEEKRKLTQERDEASTAQHIYDRYCVLLLHNTFL